MPIFAILLSFLAALPVSAQPGTTNTLTTSALGPFLSAVANGGTIVLAFDGTIATTNAVEIIFDTVIDASGHSVTITGSTNRLFDVFPGVNFTIKNVTLTGGQSVGAAGAVGSNGANSSNSTGGNGGPGGNGADGLGGAIRNRGTNYVINCTFATNSAAGGAGGNGGFGGDGPFKGGNGGNGGNGGGGYGGAVYNLGTLLLTNCSFAGNSVFGGDAGLGGTNGTGAGAPDLGSGGAGGVAQGAAFYNAGVATVFNCAFYANTTIASTNAAAGTYNGKNNGWNGFNAPDAFGGAACNTGTSSVVNCTFFGNQVTGGVGGSGGNGSFTGGNAGNGGNGWGGGVFNSGTVSVTNCTFASNVALGGAAGTPGSGLNSTGSAGAAGASLGNNIANSGGTFNLMNTILTNSATGANASGTVVDQGHNLSSDATPSLTGTGSLKNTNPNLDVLGNNGGPTLTMRLLPGSPAIDAGGDIPLAFDQRGAQRPNGPHDDIGAFEFGISYSISGKVTAGTNAVAGQGVAVADGLSTFTDTNGNYTLAMLAAGSQTVSVQPPGTYSPTSVTVTLGPTNAVNVNFSQVSPMVVSIARYETHGVTLSFADYAGLSYHVQATTNLLSATNWVTITSGTVPANGIVDLDLTNNYTTYPRRYFRVVVP